MITEIEANKSEELVTNFNTFSEDSSEWLFRGQADSGWPLQTTLERHGHGDVRFEDYYKLISTTVKSQVETMTGRTFEVPPFSDVKDVLRSSDDFSKQPKGLPGYSFMLHLRQ